MNNSKSNNGFNFLRNRSRNRQNNGSNFPSRNFPGRNSQIPGNNSPNSGNPLNMGSDGLNSNSNKQNSTDNNNGNMLPGVDNSNDNVSSSTSVDNDLNNISAKVTKKVLKKILKIISFLAIKLFIGFVAILFFIILTICVLFLPLILIGVVDVDDVSELVLDPIVSGATNSVNNSDNSISLTSTSNNDAVFPIGSNEVTTIDGVDYAIGDPATMNITATFDGNDDVHNGAHGAIDIGAEVNGVKVIAALSGTVIYPTKDDRIDYPNGYYCSRDGSGYGNYVMIDHGNGLVSLYGHMYANTITVRAGDVVKKGQIIGRTGTSGCSTGGHLHFEMRLNNKKVNPLEYISIDKPRGNINNNSEMIE